MSTVVFRVVFFEQTILSSHEKSVKAVAQGGIAAEHIAPAFLRSCKKTERVLAKTRKHSLEKA